MGIELICRCSDAGAGGFPRGRLPPAVAVGGDDVVAAEGGGGRAARPRRQPPRRMVFVRGQRGDHRDQERRADGAAPGNHMISV